MSPLALGALMLASACSLDSNGLSEPSSDAGGGVMRQTGSGGAHGAGGSVAGGSSSGGAGLSSPGDAGVASGGRPGAGGAAASSGGASGGNNAARGSGGSGVAGVGVGGAVTGAGGTIASGGATSTGGSIGPGGISGVGGVGIAGGAGSTASGGRGGAPGGAGGVSVPACGPATCANGCCEGNTCITARTAGRCGNGGAACAACGKCFRCANAGASCEVDPASTWRMNCSTAVLSATQPDGQPWDPTQAGGPGGPGNGMGSGNGMGPKSGPGPGADVAGAELPDPTCRLAFGLGAADASTSVLMNTLTPAWNESITPTPLTAGQLMSQAMPWSITVSDDDDRISSDLVCKVTPQLTAADFAAGDVTFTNVQSCTKLSVQLICAGG